MSKHNSDWNRPLFGFNFIRKIQEIERKKNRSAEAFFRRYFVPLESIISM